MPCSDRNAEQAAVDVLVVGGGPAGSAVALELLGAGVTVAVAERSTGRRPKVGEVLAPTARPLLAALGVLERVATQGHLPSPIVHCDWGEGGLYQHDLTFHPYGPNWHLDRPLFDATLLAAVEEQGGVVWRGSWLRSLARCDRDSWLVELGAATGSSPQCVVTRFVVDATGRSAAVARHLTRVRVVDDLVAVVGFLDRGPHTSVVDVVTVLEAVEDGWWYAGQLPGGRLVAGFLTDRDLVPAERALVAPHHRRTLAATAHISRLWLDPADAATVRLVPAGTSRLESFAGNGWLAVGDAAMALDPLSGDGISRALESGRRGADVVRRSLTGDRGGIDDYVADRERAFTTYLADHHRFYQREHRWPASPFWQRRHEALDPGAPVPSAATHRTRRIRLSEVSSTVTRTM
jgi:flavin-dependent dehydrogenase